MTVYVDPIMTTLKSRQWPYVRGCHLFADTVAELHQFGAEIGLRWGWFQDREDMPHFDLTLGMRKKAVAKGAEEVTAVFMVERLQANRKARLGHG